MYYANAAAHMFVLPGRLRIRIRGLVGNRRLEESIRDSLSGCKGIRSVAANRYTGNVLVLFEEKRITAPAIERLIGEAGQTTAPVVRTAGQNLARSPVRRNGADTKGPFGLAAGLFRKLTPIVFGVSSVFFIARGDFLTPLAVLALMDPGADKRTARAALRLASANASSSGTAVNNPAALGTAGRANAVVFDNTGLITAGPYRVTSVIPSGKNGESRILMLAASCGQNAGSPIGDALAEEAAGRKIELKKASAVAMSNQRGMSCLIDGQEVLVGSRHQLAEKIPLDGSHLIKEKKLQHLGQYPVFVAFNHKAIGAVGFCRAVDERSVPAIEAMRAAGVGTVKIITEENEDMVRPIAFDAGIESFEAGLSPEVKIQRIAALKEGGGAVALVRDGWGECRPGQAADITIAVLDSDSGPACRSADFVITDGDLLRIARLVELGKYTEEVSAQNRILSLGLGAIGVILLLAGRMAPYAALLYKFANSCIVWLNTSKIRKYKMIERAGG